MKYSEEIYDFKVKQGDSLFIKLAINDSNRNEIDLGLFKNDDIQIKFSVFDELEEKIIIEKDTDDNSVYIVGVSGAENLGVIEKNQICIWLKPEDTKLFRENSVYGWDLEFTRTSNTDIVFTILGHILVRKDYV